MRPRVVWLGIFILALLLTGSWTMAPAPAYACSCVEPGPMEERLERKTAVFQGTVTSIKEPVLKKIMSSDEPVKVTFVVKQLWKGEPRAELSIRTAMYEASCGYEDFRVDEEYLVFAYGDPDDLKTGLCDGTKPVAEAGEELAILGNGDLPDNIEASGSSGRTGQVDSSGQQSELSEQQVGPGRTASSGHLSPILVVLITVVAIVVLLLGARRFYIRRK